MRPDSTYDKMVTFIVAVIGVAGAATVVVGFLLALIALLIIGVAAVLG